MTGHPPPLHRSDSGFVLPLVLVVVAILATAAVGLTGTGSDARRLADTAERRAEVRAVLDGRATAYAFEAFAAPRPDGGPERPARVEETAGRVTLTLAFGSEAAKMSVNAYDEAEILRALAGLPTSPATIEELGRRFVARHRRREPIPHVLSLLTECEAAGPLGRLLDARFSTLRPTGVRTTLSGPQRRDPLTGQMVSLTWLPELYVLAAAARSGDVAASRRHYVHPVDRYPHFERIMTQNVPGAGSDLCATSAN